MKKILFVLLVLSLFIFTGCGKKEPIAIEMLSDVEISSYLDDPT